CRPPCFHLFSSFLTCGGNPARNRAACQRRCCVVEVCSSEDQRKTRPSEWLDARYLPSGLKATRELYASPTREPGKGRVMISKPMSGFHSVTCVWVTLASRLPSGWKAS